VYKIAIKVNSFEESIPLFHTKFSASRSVHDFFHCLSLSLSLSLCPESVTSFEQAAPRFLLGPKLPLLHSVHSSHLNDHRVRGALLSSFFSQEKTGWSVNSAIKFRKGS
jgi:hypothetical protein